MLSFFMCSVAMLFLWLRYRHVQRLLNQRIRTEHALKAFLAEISHEIRTPLNAIIGLLEVETRRQPADALSENVKVAFESARTLRSLIGDILDLNKIESGRYQPMPEPVLLPQLVEQTVALFNHQAAAKGLQIGITVDVNDPCANIDPSMIARILTNLLNNAIKFTESGEINVALTQTARAKASLCCYLLEVSDSGPGMTLQQQQTIFEPYIQWGNGQQQRAGVGLGLSICRGLAQCLEGELSVESTPGSGSVFSFCFHAPRARERQPRASASLTPAAPERIKVLVVDDHAPNRLLLSKQLEYAGHQVVAAESAPEALSLWQEDTQRFRLMIIDCNMPGMNGYQLAQAVRQHERERQLSPITLFGLTATAEARMVQRCLDAGMNDCLFKPLDLDTLSAHLAQYAPQQADRCALPNANTPPFEPAAADAFCSPWLAQLAGQDPEGCQMLIQSVVASNREVLAALQQGTPGESLAKLGHKLQGGARILNATRLASLCLALEKHAVNDADLPELIAAITQEIMLTEERLHCFQQQLSSSKPPGK